MNIHHNARLALVRRIDTVRSIVERGLKLAVAAAASGVSQPTARKWLAVITQTLTDLPTAAPRARDRTCASLRRLRLCRVAHLGP